MRWPFSGLFQKRGVKDSLDLHTIELGVLAPTGVTLWAIRRTEDMAELMLSFTGGKLKTVQGGGRILVADGALTLTAWFRPQHAQENARVDGVLFKGPMVGMLSGWSRVVVKRPTTAPAEMAFTAPDLLGALQDWPLVLSKNAAPAFGETGALINIGMAHGIGAASLNTITDQLKTAGAKIGRKVAPGTGATAALDVKRRAKVQVAADKAVSQAMIDLGTTSPALIDAAHATFNQGLSERVFDITDLIPPSKPQKPGLGATALELPNRLYLSPTRKERFLHRSKPFFAAGRTELWHSRLVLKESGELGGDEEASRDPAAVRPIWTPDLVDSPAVPETPTPETPAFAMTAGDRSDLVHLGADYDIGIDAAGKWLPLPARVRRLELSALGGFMDLHGQWPQPLPVGISLTAWKHRLSLGRDSRVEIVKAGVLAPFGHQAVKLVVTTREVEDVPHGLTPGDDAFFADVAILVQRTYIAVVEPRKTFDAASLLDDGRRQPLARVDVLNAVTQIESGLYKGYWPQVIGQATPMSFAVRALDQADRTVRFNMPMAFVEIGQATNETACKAFINVYNAAAEEMRQASLGRQVICLAPDDPKDSLSLSIRDLVFGVEEFAAASADRGGRHRFRPLVEAAKVEAPGSRDFAGGAKDVWVKYFEAYRTGGFGGANSGEVALALRSPLPLFTPGGGASSEKAGPVATPRVAIHGYSRLTGAVTGAPSVVEGQIENATSVLAKFADGSGLNAKALLPDMKLLGAFDLADLIVGEMTSPSAVGASALGKPMQLKREDGAEGERAILSFHQSLSAFGEGLVFSPWINADTNVNEAQLEIKAVAAIVPGDQPAAQSLDATVRRFGISFFGVVRIDFNRLAFTIKPGSKPDLDLVFADGGPADGDRRALTFTGDLAFLQQLAEILPVSAFSDPPDLQITSDGVIAGYSLGLPPIQLGALALSNIGFGARFQLPFLGDAPSLRLNFAERHSPFGVLVSLLGGGGFFAIELDTHGLKMIEGTLEAQAGIAINLGVAAGAITARLGIYYRWEVTTDGDKMTFEAFAELRGELCVLGLISASITFHVGLGVETSPAGKELIGRATVTVEIELLFFSKSVSIECERRFQGSKGDPTFVEVYPMVPVAAPALPSSPAWTAYASAFA